MKHCKHHLLCWGLIFSIWAQGAVVPQGIGILRLGDPQGEQARRALGILEARFHRWLEDQGANTSVRHLSVFLNPDLIAQERAAGALRASLEALESADSQGRWKAVQNLPSKRRPLRGNGVAGFWVARALAWESQAAWRQGRREDSKGLWNRALALAPEGEVPLGPLSDDGPTGWREMADEQVTLIRRDCRVSLPEGAVLTAANGFPLTPQGEIMLSSGHPFLLHWRDAAGQERESSVTCRGPGRLALRQEGLKSSLAGIGERFRVGSLALIEPGDQGFRLYLYTQGVGLDEIPLERPLSVSEVLARPLESELPVDNSGFGRIRLAHGLGGSLSNLGLAAVETVTGSESPAPRWYNKWTTWAVAGSVVTGILVAYLASRRPDIRTQPPGGVRIELQ